MAGRPTNLTQVGPHRMHDPPNFAERHLLQNIIFAFLSEKEKKDLIISIFHPK